jgi:hypothetical protein
LHFDFLQKATWAAGLAARREHVATKSVSRLSMLGQAFSLSWASRAQSGQLRSLPISFGELRLAVAATCRANWLAGDGWLVALEGELRSPTSGFAGD